MTSLFSLTRKMRKPDPPPGTEQAPTRKKRSSAVAVMTTVSYPKVPEAPTPIVNVERESSPPRRSSGEFLPRNVLETLSPLLPPSRPSSSSATPTSTAYHSLLSGPQPTASRTSSGAGTTSTGATSLRRKKSRPAVQDEEEEEHDSDDGAEADEEYVPRTRGLGSWVNIEGRGTRKSSSSGTTKKSTATSGTSTGVGMMLLSEARREMVDDSRRHSMAV